jgi:hypothetical protein
VTLYIVGLIKPLWALLTSLILQPSNGQTFSRPSLTFIH